MAVETPKKYVLDFEKPLEALEAEIEELRARVEPGEEALAAQLKTREEELAAKRAELYANLTAWDRVQLARHPERPYTLDYVQRLVENPLEFHGDRLFRDDQAIVCGVGKFRGRNIVWMGHEKGRKVPDKIKHNFGSPHPEGYRKALRLMKLAEKFRLPLLALLDTAGAYPGIGAEERGQAEAIARNVLEMFNLTVPFVVAVIGEGGSGGAFGIGVGNRVLMQEYAYYSVISPEGCAAILWRDRAYAPQAAAALKITADDLKGLGIIDEIVKEPAFGAHRDHDAAAELLGEAIERHLAELEKMSGEKLREDRRKKFLAMGFFEESPEGGRG
ncbi:MAG: acetyl-CoA carboxylase carboxyltransferase subunit alpha [Candidatus Coatesbacteria bacterium]|nr:MAG: acetyl-CoA carboxylase carboxyltransferase subunit alpha [Candidatus Coatesbacteria bacterium]